MENLTNFVFSLEIPVNVEIFIRILLFTILIGGLFIIVSFMLIPLYMLFNKIFHRDELNQSREDDVIGTLTVGVTNASVGEVTVKNEKQSIRRYVAKLYEYNDTEDISLEVGDTVIIIEFKNNIAYVKPYKTSF